MNSMKRSQIINAFLYFQKFFQDDFPLVEFILKNWITIKFQIWKENVLNINKFFQDDFPLVEFILKNWLTI